MKEYVQTPGVRPWHGDELVALQGEPLEALQRFLKPFGPFILDGVEVTGAGPFEYSAGIVAMEHPTDGYKVVRFGGFSGASDSGLLYLAKNVSQKLYNDGNDHDAVYDYVATYIDEGDIGYYPLDASLAPSQKVYLNADTLFLLQNFDHAFQKRVMPAFQSVLTAIDAAAVNAVSAASIETRVCRATGQVFLRGSVTVSNSVIFGPPAQWLPIKLLDTVYHYPPPAEVFFTGTIKYDSIAGTYMGDSGASDLLKTFGFSIDTDRKLYMGVVQPLLPSDVYTVHFNTSYFYL